jgi:pilus assembly protein CpaF
MLQSADNVSRRRYNGRHATAGRGSNRTTWLQEATNAKKQKTKPRSPHQVDQVELKFQQVKVGIHQDIVQSLDLSTIGTIQQPQLRAQIRSLADQAYRSYKGILGKMDRERMVDELLDEAFGIGPLEKLLRDPAVSDILVNDPHTVFIERNGLLELTDVIFADEQHLMRVIQRIVARLGRRIDEVSPMVDARLPDGSRVNATIPPLAIDGPTMSIRRFGIEPFQIDDLVENGTLLPVMAEFLDGIVVGRLGCVVSGGTGSGKTTALNAISSFIPSEERLVTIEDSAELILKHPHCVRLETRPPNTEEKGEVTQRELVRNSLRMRPDRIIVGEVRGPEVWDMLQAMNTGHDGSMTTVHANSTPDALNRLEMMVAMTGFELPISVIRQYMAAGIKVIVHLARLKGGVRRVTQISEIVEIRDGMYRLEDIFRYEQQGVSEDGIAEGDFHVTGYRPSFLRRLAAKGIELPDEMFHERRLASAPKPQFQLMGEDEVKEPVELGAT